MAEKDKAASEKPLDKMTAKELREVAKEIPEITGVHGMNKAELLEAVKQAKGIADDTAKKSSRAVRDIKKQIKSLKQQRQAALEARDGKMATIYKRRISRLKKRSRQAA
jgi:hypothetical protein